MRLNIEKAVLSTGKQVLIVDFSERESLTVSETKPADVKISGIDEQIYFLKKIGSSIQVVHQDKKGALAGNYSVTSEQMLKCGDLWVGKILDGDKGHPENVQEQKDLLACIFNWVNQPMGTSEGLSQSLKMLLQEIVTNTKAINGWMVLTEDRGLSLVATHGINLDEAEKLWQLMPVNLTQEILKTGAKIILPEGFNDTKGDSASIMVKGIRTVAGFPVAAEGKVLAILYLGFSNLFKDLSLPLQLLLERVCQITGLVLQRALLREEVRSLASQSGPAASLSYLTDPSRLMIGTSKGLNIVYKNLLRLAPVDVPTLVTGETGTGKELAARELHRKSNRQSHSFVAINAAALPESLIESELFGHKKGSFTGALSDRIGLIEQSHKGTLFIDEIGELSLNIQAKLLRVLQEKCVTRIGDIYARDVDFRLIVATHRNLNDMVKQQRFREDLYYRVAGATISLPPLRERPDDIMLLANFFKTKISERHKIKEKEFSYEARMALEAHQWSGNIRELENVVYRALIMAEQDVIRMVDLGLPGCEKSQELLVKSLEYQNNTLETARDSWMRAFLGDALKKHQGKRAETAKSLGIGQRTLFRYIEQLEIND